MSLKIILIATLLATTLQNMATNGCGPNCVTCNSSGVCEVCYREKLVDGKCDSSKPVIPHCELANHGDFQANACVQCQPGYSLTYSLITPVFCSKTPITNCFYALNIQGSRIHGCLACQGGVPNA